MSYVIAAPLVLDTKQRLLRSKLTLGALVIMALYALIALMVKCQLLGANWMEEVGTAYMRPSASYWCGTDILGQSIFRQVIKGVDEAISLGAVVSLLSVAIGLFLGAVAGYFGGWVDDGINWVANVLAAVPNIILLVALSFIMGRGIVSVYLALGLTTWVELFRLIRAEVLRHKQREYVQAARALGAGHARRLFLHILPNLLPMVIVRCSLIFQLAIKMEVVLSFLGIGVQDSPSWGKLIGSASLDFSQGAWWPATFATIALFFIVLAFNVVSDALRDALDPKLSRN